MENSMDQTIKEVQRIVAQYVKANHSLVDELFEMRREEVRKENDDYIHLQKEYNG